MRVLIADDEALARRVLREMLGLIHGIEIIGEAADGLEAVSQVHRLQPDAVFLDLQMPALDGFSVARTLIPGQLPLLIFCTAYPDRALQAFESGAVDYLLKPVRQERLEAAVAKARLQLAGLSRPAGASREPKPLRRIVGKAGADSFLLNPAEVIAFQAEGDLVYIFTDQHRYYSEHSLGALESMLEPAEFRRIRRNTIINTSHIRKISPLSSKRWMLTLSNGMEVIVSKRAAGNIRSMGGW